MVVTSETTRRSFFAHSAIRHSLPDPLVRKLRSFGQLPLGWSHGEGVPVNASAIRVAESFIEVAKTLQLKADVFPGLHGDCSVAVYLGDRSVEVVVRPDVNKEISFDLHVEEGSGFQFKTVLEKEGAGHEEVVSEMVRLAKAAWKSHDSSLSSNSTQTSAAFQTLFSSTPQESAPTRPTVS
jgi:hypothetical protein